jgi:hypothetical protein
VIYELAVLGVPSDGQRDALREKVVAHLTPFGLELDRDVGWRVGSNTFEPSERVGAAAVYFGGVGATAPTVSEAVPIVPVVSSVTQVALEIPPSLQPLNCLGLDLVDMDRVASTLLECAGLLPRQRRVFLSYRRTEAREAALQLYDAFSERQYDVFLDTRDVAAGVNFQDALWHRLVESDVMVMLDTKSYFEKRWTTAEFGRAQAKGIGVLRVGWPDAKPSDRTATVSHAKLKLGEIDAATGRLDDAAVTRICNQLEQVRSQSVAVRRLNLMGHVHRGLQSIHARFHGVGARGAVHVSLPDGRPLTLYPTLGVPTSRDLHRASNGRGVAGVVYESSGIQREWQEHMEWLSLSIRTARCVCAHDLGWALSDWDPPP